MQKLHFLGTGSGFSDSHNNCWFIKGDTLYFIDMSMLNVNKAVEVIKKNRDKKVVVLITHMHADHVSGLAMLLHKCYYNYEIEVKIRVTENLKNTIIKFLTEQNVLGAYDNKWRWQELSAYDVIDDKIIDVSQESFEFESPSWNSMGIEAFETPHAPGLYPNYGYAIRLDGCNILYTGDTNDFGPLFRYLEKSDSFKHIDKCKNERVQVYVDMSFVYENKMYSKDRIHLFFGESAQYIRRIIQQYPEVESLYFMHIDDIAAAKEGARWLREEGFVKNKYIYLAKPM